MDITLANGIIFQISSQITNTLARLPERLGSAIKKIPFINYSNEYYRNEFEKQFEERE